MITKKKEQNHTLNILKVICAILIVFNHCVFPNEFGKIIKDISRIAVPIFFIISGYFSYQNNENKIKNKFKRIFLMFVGACIFWFLFTIIRYAIISPIEIKYYLKSFIDLKRIFHFFIFNDNIFWGHLWFFNALLYCYGINFIKQHFKFKINYATESIIAIALILGYFLLNKFIVDDNYSNAYFIRNFLFVGLPFYLIGKNIHHFNINKYFKKNCLLIILLFISFILLFVERNFYASEIYISTLFESTFLFIFCLNNPNMNNKTIEYIGNNLNLYIYIFHPAIKYIILDVIEKLNINNITIMYIYPVIALLFTTLFSYFIYKFNNFISTIKKH